MEIYQRKRLCVVRMVKWVENGIIKISRGFMTEVLFEVDSEEKRKFQY